MFLKNLALGFAVAVGALSTQASFADTLTLKGTSSVTAGNAYVYPYALSFNGASQTTPMMCINYNDEITTGETWQVSGQQLSTSSSAQLQEDAYLFSMADASSYTDAQIQLAVWYILAPNTAQNAAWNNSVELGLVTLAENEVPGLTNSFLNQYTVLSPVLSNQAGWTDGTPQSFLVKTSAVTPEPTSLLLLGTGLCAASLLLMRRRANQEQPQF